MTYLRSGHIVTARSAAWCALSLDATHHILALNKELAIGSAAPAPSEIRPTDVLISAFLPPAFALRP